MNLVDDSIPCFALTNLDPNCCLGNLSQLMYSGTYAPNSFVLIPYNNPQVKKIEPLFYKILHTSQIELPSIKDNQEPFVLQSRTTKEKYINNLFALKEQIQQGNIYEITYCISFYAKNIAINPLAIFKKLNQLSKAPYSCLVKLEDDYIISASPELFLKKEGNTLSTKPIKGTIKRGKDAEEDTLLKTTLYNSLKERTENVMAVDVARNDLSLLAQKASVQVNKLYNIETFETLHQMVSTVSCELKENSSFEQIMNATFPMASMTGAPKYKAMELIDKYENFERHFYSGAMGIIDQKNDFSLAVNIRSIFYNQKAKHISIAVGSAITHLCEPEKEYEECLLKAQALLKVLNASIETN